MPLAKKIFKGLVAALCAIAVALAPAKIYFDSQYFAEVDPVYAKRVEFKLAPPELKEDRSITPFSFEGFRGAEVHGLLTVPKDAKPPLPCVVYMHGIRDRKNSLDDGDIASTFLKKGFALATYDQIGCGDRARPANAPWYEVLADLRIRAAANTLEVHRIFDFLSERDGIDSKRIYLLPCSYGAISGGPAAARETRARAVAFCYGGGDVPGLLTAPLIQESLGKLLLPAQLGAWYIGSAFDAAKFIGQVSPRPVYVSNGEKDSIVAMQSAKALHAAAREPKELRWYPSEHLGTKSGGDIALQKQVFGDACDFFLRH